MMIWISNLFEAYCKTLIVFKVLDAVLLLCILYNVSVMYCVPKLSSNFR